ncbi:MAG: transposase [Kurthia sp.]|nr:transposase [Candidatus Kurthia equi]
MAKHIKSDGKLLQANKSFSQLKSSQREKIYKWMKSAYIEAVVQNIPQKKQKNYILDTVEDKIIAADIWIPFYEVEKFYNSKIGQIRKKAFPNKEEQ